MFTTRIAKFAKLMVLFVFALILPVLVKTNGVQAANDGNFTFNGEVINAATFYNTHKNEGAISGDYIYFASRGKKATGGTKYKSVGMRVRMKDYYGDVFYMEYMINDGNVLTTVVDDYEKVEDDETYIYVVRRAKLSLLKSRFIEYGKATDKNTIYNNTSDWEFNTIMTIVKGGTQLCGAVRYDSNNNLTADKPEYLYRNAKDIQAAESWGNPSDLDSFYDIKKEGVPASKIKTTVDYSISAGDKCYYYNNNYYLGQGGKLSLNLSAEIEGSCYVSGIIMPNYLMLGIEKDTVQNYYAVKRATNNSLSQDIYNEDAETLSNNPLTNTIDKITSNSKMETKYTLTNNMADTNMAILKKAIGACYYKSVFPSRSTILGDTDSETPVGDASKSFISRGNTSINKSIISDLSAPSVSGIDASLIGYGTSTTEVKIENITDSGSGINSINIANSSGSSIYSRSYSTYTTSSGKITLPSLSVGTYTIYAYDNVGNSVTKTFSVTKPTSYNNTFTASSEGWNPRNLSLLCSGGTGYIKSSSIGLWEDDNTDKITEDIMFYSALSDSSVTGTGFIDSDKPWLYIEKIAAGTLKSHLISINPYEALKTYASKKNKTLIDGWYNFFGDGGGAASGGTETNKELKFDFNPPTYSGSDFSTSTSGGSWKTTLPQNGITLMDGASGPTIGKGKIVVKKYDNNDKVVASILGDSISGSGSTGFGSTKYIRYFDYTEAVDDVTPWSKVTDTITQGKNKYAVECSDNAGNNGTLYLYYKYDSVAPEVSVTLNNATASDYTSVVKRDDGNFDLYIGADGKIPSGLNITLRDNTSGVSNVTIKKRTSVTEKLGSGGTSNYYTYTNFNGQIYYGSYDYSAGGYTSKTAVDVFSGDDVANKITSGNITKGPPYRIEIATTDNAGNSVTKYVYIHVDNTAPKLFIMSEGGYKNNAFSGTRTVMKNDMITEIKKYDNSSTGKTESLTTTSTLGWYQKDIGMMFCVMNDDEKELKECYIECTTTGKKYNITSSEVYTQTGYDNQYALVGVHTSYATKLSVPKANRRYYFESFVGLGDNNEIVNKLLDGKDEGQFYCRLVASDYAGNTSKYGFYVKLDKTPPEINVNSTVGKNGYNYRWGDEFEIQDMLSGLKNPALKNASGQKYSFDLMKCPDGGIANYVKYDQTAGLNSTKKWYFVKTSSTGGPFQSVYVTDAAGNEATLDITKTDNTAPTVKCIYGYNRNNTKIEDWGSLVHYASAKFEDESNYKLNCNPEFVKVNFQDILPENPGAKEEISGIAYCEVEVIKDTNETTGGGYPLSYNSFLYRPDDPNNWGDSYGYNNDGIWSIGDKNNTSGVAVTETKDGIASILIYTDKWDGLHTRFKIRCIDVAGNEYTTYSEPLIFDRKKPEYSVKYNGCTDDAGTTWNPSSVDITMRTNLINYKDYSITNDFSGSENQIISTKTAPYIRPCSVIGSGGYTDLYETENIFKMFTGKCYPGTSAKNNINTTIATEEHNTITLNCATVINHNSFDYPYIIKDEEIKLNIDRTLPVIPKRVKAEGEGGEDEYQISFERNDDDTMLTVKTDSISDALSGIKQVDIKVCKTDGTVVKEYENITVNYSDGTHKQGSFDYKIPVSDLGGVELNGLWAHVYARDVANNYGFVARDELIMKKGEINVNLAKIRRHVPSMEIFRTSFTRGEFGHVDLDIDCENDAYITKIEVKFPKNFDVPYYEEGQPYYEDTKDQRMDKVLEFEPPVTEFKDSVDFYIPLDNMVPMNYDKYPDGNIGEVRGEYNPDKFGDIEEYTSMRDAGRLEEYAAQSKENKMFYGATVIIHGMIEGKEKIITYAGKEPSEQEFSINNNGIIKYPDLVFTVKDFSLRRTVKAFHFGSFFQRLYKKYHWTSITDVTDYWSAISEEKYGMKRFQ